MKHKKVKLCTLLLFGLGLSILQAQSGLYVMKKTGTQTQFTFNSITKLTFASGYMTVNKTDGNSNIYALGDIRYLSFIDLTTDVSQISNQGSGNVMLYPNPATDQLQISFESVKTGNVQVEIIDAQGKVLQRQTLNCKNGNNHAIISLSQLSGGLYICRLQNYNKLETIKFIKN